MPNPAHFNLDFRPHYWNNPNTLLANIKGERRREIIRAAAQRGYLETLPASTFADDIDPVDREQLCRLGRQMAAGEFLPPYYRGEIEIARVSFDSTFGDVVCLRARPYGKGIGYRWVDDFSPYDHRHRPPSLRSKLPLTLGELIHVFDSRDEGFLDGRLGMTKRFYEEQLGLCSPEDAVLFITISSELYPHLAAWYAEEAREWIAEKRANAGREA